MNAAGIAMFSEASFLRHQRKLVIPVIDEWWCWMHNVIFNGSERQSLQVCGDGQYDSPGFSAKYMCYSIQDISSGYIVHMEFMDERMCDMVSTRMEPAGCIKSIEKLSEESHVECLVTDASSTIIDLMSKYTYEHTKN